MKFRTILADPPWDYGPKDSGGRNPTNHYSCMSIESLCTLPVKQITDKDAVLLLWCTWPFAKEGIKVMEAWGFKYVTGFPWLKLSKSDLPKMSTGYHSRGCTEPILIGTRGKGAVPPPELREAGVLLHRAGAHSAKPECQYRIAQKYPGPYLSLFDRPWWGMLPPPDGWHFVGNEIDGLDAKDALERLAALPHPALDLAG